MTRLPYNTSIVILILSFSVYFCTPPSTPVVYEEAPETFPMDEISLETMEGFKPTGKNWKIVSSVMGDINVEHKLTSTPGTGTLINTPTAEDREHLFTSFEHGDMELELEFLMASGSNSGVYFQGRYEVQLLDSWLETELSSSDCGGIYKRFDDSRPEGQKGYEGSAPLSNACKAPGLWQHYKIYFIAPRFDASGKKIKNARFEHVYLNGALVQRDVEVTGPTRAAFFEDEKPFGPLMIQGDHGPMAIRNIKYKVYGTDSLSLENLNYKVYKGPFKDVPDFDTLQAVSSGTADLLDVSTITDLEDHYGVLFEGKLNVPISGDYLFTTNIDDMGDLYIDGVRVVHNRDRWVRGMVGLTRGQHDFKLTFVEGGGRAEVVIYYEGKGIQKQTLAEASRKGVSVDYDDVLMINPGEYPEMTRGFVNHGDGPKKTHTISVGDPLKVHYTYNLQNGALLKAWRGDYANVEGMWEGRGGSQLLKPGNGAIETTDGPQVTMLSNSESVWPDTTAAKFKATGYFMSDSEHPVFTYRLNEINFTDAIVPSADSVFLTRTVTALEGELSNLWFRIAKGTMIDKLEGGMYRIDGMYYIKLEGATLEKAQIRKTGELIVPFPHDTQNSTIQYTLIW